MRELRRTCEEGHALIWHREWVCPACEMRETIKQLQHANEMMEQTLDAMEIEHD